MDIDQMGREEKFIQWSTPRLLISIAEDRPTRIQILLWAVVVLVGVSVSSSKFFIYQVGSNNDEPRYLTLSRSLIYAHQYGMIHSPGDPLPERYPFGYPLLISPIVRLFPAQLDAPKALSLAATVMNITLLFWGWQWFCQSRSYWWALAIAGLYAVSPVTIEYSRRLMSEPVFMVFCLITILLAEKYVRGGQNRWLITGMSAALAFVVFTRTIGVVLLVGVFIYILFKKGREAWRIVFSSVLQISLLAGLIIAVTPVQPRDLLPLVYLNGDESARPLMTFLSGNALISDQEAAQPSPSHPWVQKLSALRHLFTFGIRQHLGSDVRAITLPYGEGILSQFIERTLGDSTLFMLTFGFMVSGLVIFGLYRLVLQEGLSLFILYAILYFCALFLWIWNNPRLLYPIQPQIQLGWLVALETILSFSMRTNPRRILSGRFPRIALVLITSLMLIASIVKSSRAQDSRVHTGDLRTRSEWLKANSDASDIVMTEEPELDYLYSERKTIMFPESVSSNEELDAYLVENRVDYILVVPNMRWYSVYTPIHSDLANHLIPLFEELRSDDRLELVYASDPDLTHIYQVTQQEKTTRTR